MKILFLRILKMNAEVETKLNFLQNLISNRQVIAEKVIDLESNCSEHRYLHFAGNDILMCNRNVIAILEKTEPERKALRTTGSVVVERSAGEILTSVKDDVVQVFIGFLFFHDI